MPTQELHLEPLEVSSQSLSFEGNANNRNGIGHVYIQTVLLNRDQIVKYHRLTHLNRTSTEKNILIML